MTANKDKCQALSSEGKQCKNLAVRNARLHLQRDIYGCKWVKTRLCKCCFRQLYVDDSFEI